MPRTPASSNHRQQITAIEKVFELGLSYHITVMILIMLLYLIQTSYYPHPHPQVAGFNSHTVYPVIDKSLTLTFVP